MDQAQNLRNIIKRGSVKSAVRARILSVTSGKGGVGKSSVSVNLAIELARRGKNVVIFDADFGLANVEVMLGIRPLYSLADMMYHGKSLNDIVCEGPEGVGFISGGSGIREMSDMNEEQLLNLTMKLRTLDRLADIVIIDTGAGISDTVMELVMLSSEVLLVTTPEPTSITDAYALLKSFDRKPEYQKKKTSIELIANRVNSISDGMELYRKLSSVSERFLDIPLDYLGEIPYDGNISKAVMKQQPIAVSFPESPAAKAIGRIADSLLGGGSREPELKRGLSDLLKEFFYRTSGR